MEKINIAIQLEQEDKHISVDEYTLDTDVTLKGLLYVNQLVGASLFLPDRIFIDGEVRENPYIIRAEDGSVLRATATAVAVVNLEGKEVTSTATVSVDTKMYFINELMSLVTYNSAIGGIVKKGTRKEDDKTLIYSINDELDIFVNVTSPDVLIALEHYQSNKTYGERLAISLAQRNALKKLPQFNSPLKGPYGTANQHNAIMVIPYYYNSKEQLNKAVEAAKKVNGNILDCKLVSVDKDTVIDEQNDSVWKQLDRQPFDKKIHREVRKKLSEKYSTMDKEKVKEAMSILYPMAQKVADLNNKEMQILFQYVENL